MATRAPIPAAVVTWGALVVVYVVWGSTYLGIRIVVEHAPPLLSMGVRFVFAGVLLACIIAWREGKQALRLTPAQVQGVAFLGFSLLLLGNGMVAVAEAYGARSGMTALLIAVTPLIIVLLRILDGDKPRAQTTLGVVVGFVGLVILVGWGAEQDLTDPAPLWTSLLIIFAATSWAIGSYGQRRLTLPENAFVVAAWEMILGGSMQLALGQLLGERLGVNYPASVWWSMGYLVLFGSLAAFSAYVWLVANAPISLVATYAYVNPVIAVCLGWLILREQLTLGILLGGGIVVVAVALVITAERRPELDSS